MRISKFILMGGGILIVLILILVSLWKIVGLYVQSSLNLVPTPSSLPANIEIIVPETEGLSGWLLSPKGDKIGYVLHIGSTSTPFLLSPTTGKRQNLDDCKVFAWADNETLFCFNNASVRAIDDDTDVITLSLKKANAAEVDLTALLQNASIIYRFNCSDLSQSLWLRDVADSSNTAQNYFIHGVEDIDTTLQEYTSVTVPCIKPVGGPVEKVYSPDSMYYFNVTFTANDQAALTVHNAINDEKMAEFVTKELESIILGGWAADSSGVYFEVAPRGRFPDSTNIGKILKLKVSE